MGYKVESPACVIHLKRLTENRETSLILCARFPRFGSDNDATVEEFQRIWFHFYGDASETLESDFVITRVNEYEELPDILTDRVSVIDALDKVAAMPEAEHRCSMDLMGHHIDDIFSFIQLSRDPPLPQQHVETLEAIGTALYKLQLTYKPTLSKHRTRCVL